MAAHRRIGCRVAGAHERWLQWQSLRRQYTAAAREAALAEPIFRRMRLPEAVRLARTMVRRRELQCHCNDETAKVLLSLAKSDRTCRFRACHGRGRQISRPKSDVWRQNGFYWQTWRWLARGTRRSLA